MADISVINTYNVKDTIARNDISAIIQAGYQNASQVQALIKDKIGGITGVTFSIVTSLPATGVTGTIYLIAHTHSGSNNSYDEYVWLASSGKYEKIGNTDVDLSQYLQKGDIGVISNTDIDTIIGINHRTASSANESVLSMSNAGSYPSAGNKWSANLSEPLHVTSIKWSLWQGNGDSSPRDGDGYICIKHANNTEERIAVTHWSNVPVGGSRSAEGNYVAELQNVVAIGLYSQASANLWGGSCFISGWYE